MSDETRAAEGQGGAGLVEALSRLERWNSECDFGEMMEAARPFDRELLTLRAEVRNLRTALEGERLIAGQADINKDKP